MYIGIYSIHYYLYVCLYFAHFINRKFLVLLLFQLSLETYLSDEPLTQCTPSNSTQFTDASNKGKCHYVYYMKTSSLYIPLCAIITLWHNQLLVFHIRSVLSCEPVTLNKFSYMSYSICPY
jgi:hypothetical protein